MVLFKYFINLDLNKLLLTYYYYYYLEFIQEKICDKIIFVNRNKFRHEKFIIYICNDSFNAMTMSENILHKFHDRVNDQKYVNNFKELIMS